MTFALGCELFGGEIIWGLKGVVVLFFGALSLAICVSTFKSTAGGAGGGAISIVLTL